MKRNILSFVLAAMIVAGQVNIGAAEKKKVLYIDSYHAEYGWSAGVANSILGVLNAKLNDDGTIDDSASDVEIKIFHMDTKRNTSEEFLQQAAQKANDEILSWQPDVVITSDDNAAKYVVVPYLKDTEIPVVFCGVNWDAGKYGFPTENITGILEVIMIPQILATLKPFAQGERVGYLAPGNRTNKIDIENFHKTFQLDVIPRFASSFEEWMKAFSELQEEVDMILFGTGAEGFPDWDEQTAIDFFEANTTIPTGATYDWMAPLALVGYATIAEEHGAWSAQTALSILDGTSPADIPITMNTKGSIYLNMRIAKKLGIRFPLNLVKRATLIQ